MHLPARVGLITLACRDLERMARLFRDLGWPETPESDEHHRTFQCTNGVAYGLYDAKHYEAQFGPPADGFRGFTIKGVCGVPATAKAVSLNLTVVTPTADGFFSMWPFGGAFPVVSTINFVAGEPAIANGAIVPLAAGTPDLNGVYGIAVGSATTHALMDVTGYFQ